jgi:hypothetical protein
MTFTEDKILTITYGFVYESTRVAGENTPKVGFNAATL